MVKETAGQEEFLLTIIYFEHFIILVQPVSYTHLTLPTKA